MQNKIMTDHHFYVQLGLVIGQTRSAWGPRINVKLDYWSCRETFLLNLSLFADFPTLM